LLGWACHWAFNSYIALVPQVVFLSTSEHFGDSLDSNLDLGCADPMPRLGQESTVMLAGDYKTQFHAKAAAMGDALINGSHDFGFLHVKAVDDTGHDRAVPMKVKLHSPPLNYRLNLRRCEPARLVKSP
jgi:hypothetical protein